MQVSAVKRCLQVTDKNVQMQRVKQSEINAPEK